MNRMEEYEALLRQPEELPPALEGSVGRARARARRRRWRRFTAPPAAWRRWPGLESLCW